MSFRDNVHCDQPLVFVFSIVNIAFDDSNTPENALDI